MVVDQDPMKTKVFQERTAFLKDSQWWSSEEFAQYQLQELKDLLAYCNDNIPYYQKLFKQEKIDLSRIKSLNDIKMIPFLTKQDIQGHYEEFVPLNVNINELKDRSTGGSTGTPLTVYADLDFLSKDKANTVYYMSIAGFDPLNYRSLRIYGDRIPQECIEKGEYWYEKDNKLIMSCYHYSMETLPEYFKKINAYQPDYIHSRSSALLPLTDYILNQGAELKVKLGAIFLDGEFLTPAQRNRIEAAFNCRVFNIYGHTEGCAVGISCQESRLLHFMPQVGLVELLDDQGNDVQEEGKRGELVVTGFNNRVFPLIRYRTFDVGVHTNEDCPCGRKYKMLKSIDGRMQDFVVNFRSNLVPLSPAVFNYNDMDWQGIKQFQVFQDQVGRLKFKIVREKEFEESRDKMAGRILNAFGKIFNNTFELEIEYVEEIPRTRIGKFRYLDQKLDVKSYALPE